MQRRLIHLGGGLAVAVALVSGAQAEPSSPSNPADPALGVRAQPAHLAAGLVTGKALDLGEVLIDRNAGAPGEQGGGQQR